MRSLRRLAIGVLAAGSALMLLTFVVGGPLAEQFFVFTGLLFPGALIALGTRGSRRPWRVLLPCGLTLLLEVSAAAIVFGDPGSGVPAAFMGVGLGLLPLIAVPLIHAATFSPPRVSRNRERPVRPAP